MFIPGYSQKASIPVVGTSKSARRSGLSGFTVEWDFRFPFGPIHSTLAVLHMAHNNLLQEGTYVFSRPGIALGIPPGA